MSAQSLTSDPLAILPVAPATCATTGALRSSLTVTFTIQNVGSAASQAGHLDITFPDATTGVQSLPGLTSEERRVGKASKTSVAPERYADAAADVVCGWGVATLDKESLPSAEP